jgi:agmatine deiminase
MSLATPRAQGFRWPAEWEPQRATWLAWPHNENDWPGKFAGIKWVFCEMIRWLTSEQRVGLLVQSDAELSLARHTLGVAGAAPDQLDIVVASTNRSWTRDYLPTWLVPSASDAPRPAAMGNAVPTLGAVKWRFNGWARYPNHELDEAAGHLVAAERTPLVWTPRHGAADDSPRFVLEGGAIDTDGQGTLLTTSDCLLGTAFPRNPGLNQLQMERVLGDHLAVDKVIWLPADVAGDDTSGHVDDVARFVGPARVVLARESNPKDQNYLPLERAREYLETERDARGRRLEVIALPMPLPVHYDGERLPASYANFLIANGLVLVPTFNDPSDRVALGLLGELFPDRQVVGIHSLDLVLGLGSVHCSTHHEPLSLAT